MKQLIGLVIIVMVSLVGFGCSKGENTNISQEVIEDKVVEVMEITEDIYPRTLEYFGTVNTIGYKKYSFPQIGKIANIFVEEGQRVGKGDTLAQLDTKDHDLAFEEAVNNLTKAATSYEYMEDYHNKIKPQWESGKVSQQEYDKVKLDFDFSEANLKNSLIDYENKLNILDETQLCTDMDGYVMDIKFQPGEIVEKGKPVIIIREDQLIINIGVPQEDVAKIKDSVAQIIINGKQLFGSVVHIDQIPDERSRTYNVEIALTEEKGLMLGETAKVTIVWGEDKGTAIPITSIINSDTDYVHVVDEQRIVKKPIEIGRIVEDYVLVSGLEVGDLLVVEGLKYIIEGDQVKLQ